MHICRTGCPCRLVHIIVDAIFYVGVDESVKEEIRHRRRDKTEIMTDMYIVNKLVAIITMLSSCATAIAMSALFTTYVAIAPDKATRRRAMQNYFRLIGDRSAQAVGATHQTVLE